MQLIDLIQFSRPSACRLFYLLLATQSSEKSGILLPAAHITFESRVRLIRGRTRKTTAAMQTARTMIPQIMAERLLALWELFINSCNQGIFCQKASPETLPIVRFPPVMGWLTVGGQDSDSKFDVLCS
jgi:hypothetical protein